MLRFLLLGLTSCFIVSGSFSQNTGNDVLIYVQRLKKSTNSDKDYVVMLNDKTAGTLIGVNPAISAQSKGQWLVAKCPFQGKVNVIITDKKEVEVDRISIETFPGRSYFVEFNPGAGYGVKALKLLTNLEGRKKLYESAKIDIKIIDAEINDRVWAEKSEMPDENQDESSLASLPATETQTIDFDPTAVNGRSNLKVESSLGTEFQTEVNKGKYYALIIGIQDYLDPGINDLDQPVRDAQGLFDVLTKFYTFEKDNVILLTNPKRQQITKSLDDLLERVGSEDNLLIFYAGHGHWDEKLKQGFWLPSDATSGNRGTWFSNADLKTYIGGINARHTLLITDACFGGAIFKTREAFTDASSDIKELYKYPSRKAMTSGALNAVPDKSVFIEYLVKRLDQNKTKYTSAEQLFFSFKTAVINNSANNQIPQFGEIRETGDEGGDFIFVRK